MVLLSPYYRQELHLFFCYRALRVYRRIPLLVDCENENNTTTKNEINST